MSKFKKSFKFFSTYFAFALAFQSQATLQVVRSVKQALSTAAGLDRQVISVLEGIRLENKGVKATQVAISEYLKGMETTVKLAPKEVDLIATQIASRGDIAIEKILLESVEEIDLLRYAHAGAVKVSGKILTQDVNALMKSKLIQTDSWSGGTKTFSAVLKTKPEVEAFYTELRKINKAEKAAGHPSGFELVSMLPETSEGVRRSQSAGQKLKELVPDESH